VDLSLTAEQLDLRDTAQRFLRDEITPQLIIAEVRADTAVDRGLWTALADMGWLAMTTPGDRGGVGASATDAGVLFEELGRGPALGPIFQSGVLAPAILAALPSSDLVERAAGPLMNGDEIATVILAAHRGLPAARGTVDVVLDGTTLRGRARFVPEARNATHAVVVVPTGSSSGALVCAYVSLSTPGVTIAPHNGFAARQYAVEFDNVRVDPSSVVSIAPDAESAVVDAILRSIPALCAFQVGSSEAVYEMSRTYSRERVQFGRPIGNYQRVQDHVIEIANAMDSARWVTYYALSKLDLEPDTLPREAIHVAKSATAEGHLEACNRAHEVHAGIGTDMKYGLPVHTFASRGLYAYLGDPAWHRARLASLLGIRVNGSQSR
jgi:alkylation response protein AidB-like acyl-CoA dehydrogenase